jgi:hypothetical protein
MLQEIFESDLVSSIAPMIAKNSAASVGRGYEWDEEEIDDWVEGNPTSKFLNSIRPDLGLAADKAKDFMVDTVLEELKNLDMLNPATWEPDKYQAWC